uniref:Uncharacterized protein n=1 Tax=Arundo donax TaxID=35708 RepID=A0A0A8ZFQ2_ARUDO
MCELSAKVNIEIFLLPLCVNQLVSCYILTCTTKMLATKFPAIWIYCLL